MVKEEEPYEWTEQDVRAIRGVGRSKGGKLLVKLLRQEVDLSVNNFLTLTSLGDGLQVGEIKGRTYIGKMLYELLTADVNWLIEQYAPQVEEQEEQEEDGAKD